VCVRICAFGKEWVCVCVGFVMCGVFMWGNCNMWYIVCVGFVMCGSV